MLWRRRWNVTIPLINQFGAHPYMKPDVGVYSMDGDYGVGKTQRSQGHWDHIAIMAFFYMGFN